MSKISIFIFLVFIGVLGLFAMENQESVVIRVPFGGAYETTRIALILLSSTAGAIIVLFAFFIRDTRRMIGTLQYQKRQKREAKLHDLYARASQALLGHKEEEAKAALDDILREDPEHVDALLRLGDILSAKGDFEAARESYRKARDIRPSNIEALLSLSAVWEKTGCDSEALRYLDEILDRDSENLTALLRKRAILERMDRWADILPVQKSIIRLEQDEKRKAVEEGILTGFTYEYARASLENGEPEKAGKSFKTILKTDSAFIPAVLGLAEVMITNKETEEAIDFLENVIDQTGSLVVLERLEDLLISVGEPGRLIRFYKKALSRNRNARDLRILFAKLYCRLEMVDDAYETIDGLDTGTPNNHLLTCLRGEIFLKKNQTNAALAEFRKCCGANRSQSVEYTCAHCRKKNEDWTGRCPSCGLWNTLAVTV